jgi:hypothetical protein
LSFLSEIRSSRDRDKRQYFLVRTPLTMQLAGVGASLEVTLAS